MKGGLKLSEKVKNKILKAYRNRMDIKIFDTDTNTWEFVKTMDNYFGIPIEDFLTKYQDKILDIIIYRVPGCPRGDGLC
jgi:hypothetical protein